MEIIDNILNTTIESFDFGLVIIINIATYLINKVLSEFGIRRLIVKRCVLLIVSVFLGIFYHVVDGENDKLILNSVILAPVFWSWIGKPIAKKLKIDYAKDVES